jgi:hypothetical protein
MQAVRRAGGAPKIRLWLQDFSREVQYDAVKVRAEIDSAEQMIKCIRVVSLVLELYHGPKFCNKVVSWAGMRHQS